MFKAGWWVCAAATLEILANAESGFEVLIPPFLAPPTTSPFFADISTVWLGDRTYPSKFVLRSSVAIWVAGPLAICNSIETAAPIAILQVGPSVTALVARLVIGIGAPSAMKAGCCGRPAPPKRRCASRSPLGATTYSPRSKAAPRPPCRCGLEFIGVEIL